MALAKAFDYTFVIISSTGIEKTITLRAYFEYAAQLKINMYYGSNVPRVLIKKKPVFLPIK